MGMEHPERPDVFLCYSHEDQRWLEELLLQLKPLEDRHLLDCWSDQEIAPGRQWQEEIERALASARVAVLLVSPAFLASSFIAEKELPSLLRAAAKGDLTILWIPVSASNYRHTELVDYQAAHPPERPLNTLRKSERERAFVEISDKILKAAGSPGRRPPSFPPADPVETRIAAEEDFPILRRSRGLWAGLGALLGVVSLALRLPFPLPAVPISPQFPLLTWQRLGWMAIFAVLIPCCVLRFPRERFVYKVLDQLTDTVLLITGALLDLASHWRHHARRWAVGLVVAAILIFPAALFGFGRLRSHLDRMDNVSAFRRDLQRFVSYGRLQGGNEAELSVLTRAYGNGERFPPEALSTEDLRVTYKMIRDLHELQNTLLNADFESRRRRMLDFWKDFLERPAGDPPAEGTALDDHLAWLALRARARSLLLSHNGTSAEALQEIQAAEAEYGRLRELAPKAGNEETRRAFTWVALNGLGTLRVLRYRRIMNETGEDVEGRKAALLSEAAAYYRDSITAEAGGDDGEDARVRTANNQADLEIYLLKEALAANEHFAEALDHHLYDRYVDFRDHPASIERWVRNHAGSLEEKARFSRNPSFFLTVAQINALAAERLLQERPECRQRLADPAEELGPACAEVAQTLRNGFFNLSTSIYLGQPAKGIAKEPRKHFACVYFSTSVTGRDAEFLFARFKARPDLRSCP